ncbi:hypothetical protein [Polynucleobacter sphagniphilus]|uniref:hypothetical protein n=1 Tax=Polynucleobacter sphagniphilus TaxID=1743169 RepID=UPI002475D19B|nr:hypothetical protein [Polynucleobacter sphagniphilus]MDH6154922.1 hypothetical protein [Polynucleobacter sphagniphilus]MDH6524556.1 hypothetical protein [Polynucleobacter sphagniphilus]
MINNNYEANLPFWEKDEWSIEEFLRARIERYGYIKSILDQSEEFNRPKYEQSTINTLTKIEEVNACLFDPDQPYAKYTSQDINNKIYEDFYQKLKGVEGGLLIHLAYRFLKERDLAIQAVDLLAKELLIVSPEYITNVMSHYEATKNRQEGREKKYRQDKNYMRQCLNVITRFKQTIVDPEHYIPFRNLVIKHYKPSENNGEAIPVEDGIPHGWAESTMREFFEEETGEKPTSLL